jgi:hypothetical protein
MSALPFFLTMAAKKKWASSDLLMQEGSHELGMVAKDGYQ